MKPGLNRLLFFLFLPFFIARSGFSDEIIHVMQRGETIYSIARSYGLSAQEVMTHNRISDARTVQAGARIRIPGNNTTRPSPPRQTYEEYQVQRNDTLFSLARRYGIQLAELLDMNGFSPDYVIKAGEKIRVPVLASAQASNPPAPVNPPAATVRIDPGIRWPINAREISNITGRLNGVLITGERQESVKSLTAGTVVSVGPYRGFGRVAIVQSPGGYFYVYGGCETILVKEGDKVSSGTELGRLGVDTKTSTSQLFFFVYRGNTAVDPFKAPRA